MVVCNLKVFLAQRNITARSLSLMTGLSEVILSKMSNNKFVEINIDYVNKICTALDCDISDIYKFKKDKSKTQIHKAS